MNDPTIGYAGVDWATDAHAVCVVDERRPGGRRVRRHHTAQKGWRELCRRVQRAGARRVAIERPDGPVVDALLAAELEVVVVSSPVGEGAAGALRHLGQQVRPLRRLRAGRLLAHRRAPLASPRSRTRRPRSPCAAMSAPARTSSSPASQSPTSCAPTCASCSPAPSACSPTSTARSRCASSNGSRPPAAPPGCPRSASAPGCGPTATAAARPPAELHRRLSAAPAGLTGDEGDARGAITLAYVTVLKTLRAQIDELDTRLDELLDAHPDAHIFRSLPRCATVRAATLLAEIGDCRARFPDPESLACLAGVAPSTRASGRHRAVTFRWSSDKKLRDAICDFAGDSWRANAWAEPPLPHNCAPQAKPTPTPNASSPAAGPTSSGAAGKTTPPTTPPATAATNASQPPRLDIGLLTDRGQRPAHAASSGGVGRATGRRRSRR